MFNPNPNSSGVGRRIVALAAMATLTGGLMLTATLPASAADLTKTGPFCTAAIAAIAAPPPDTPDDKSTYTAAHKASQKAYAKILVSSIDIMLKDAPADTKADLQAQRKVAVGVVATGVESDDALPGLGGGVKLLSTVGKNCASSNVALTATDFKFAGLPATMKAGLAAFTLKNTSKVEMHHIVVFRKNNGVTASAKALLDAEDESKAQFVGFINDIKPGTTGSGLVNLTAGNYFVSCFLPVGGKETGMPHYKSGMYAEFVVK